MKTSGNSSVSAFVDRWRQGEPPCAQAVLRANPELARNKSAVLDLAYEEFCLRKESGDSIAPSTFCNQFPTYSKSLERLLEMHELLAANGALTGSIDVGEWPAVGDEFLGFQLHEDLGKGALARVFLAGERACGDRLVVLKVSRQGGHEANILGRLPHPHIVPILMVKEDQRAGLSAVCMPFLGRATLCDVIDEALAEPGSVDAQIIVHAAAGKANPRRERRRVGEPRLSHGFQTNSRYVNAVLKLGISLAEALQFAHEKGILHRDIKASNVLLTTAGMPMLLDFNLSSDERTEDLRIGGTLPYAPPEQLRAIAAEGLEEIAPIDARADIFSLGVVLYELLSGKLPFGSGSLRPADNLSESLSARVEASARAILTRQATGSNSLRTLNPSVDPAAAGVVERCLQFSPASRPASAAELVKLLQGCLTPRRRLIRWSRTHRALVAALSLAATVLILCGAIAIAMRPPYANRMRHIGQQHLNEGKFAEAADDFSLALKAKPDDVSSWVGRAAAFQGQKDFVSASRDYASAADYSPAGSIRAAVAYCFAHDFYYASAEKWSRLAIEAHEETPEVYNNFAFSQLAGNEQAAARDNLDRAIERHPTFAAPYHNRAVVELSLHYGDDHVPLKHALDDVEQALGLEPNCPELLFDAASVNVAAGRLEIAKRYLMESLKAGLPHEKLKNQPQFTALCKLPEVKKLLDAPVPPRAAPPPVRLVPILVNVAPIDD